MADEITIMYKVPSRQNWPNVAAELLQKACGAQNPDGARVRAAAGRLKAANGNAENPDDAVSTFREVAWYGVWKGEVIKVPMSLCAGGVQLAQPSGKNLGNLGTVKRGETKTITLSLPVKSASDGIKITLENCAAGVVISKPNVSNGKLTAFEVKVDCKALLGEYTVLIRDVNDVYTATIKVEQAENKRCGRPPRDSRPCTKEEIAQGVKEGHDPAKEDCRVVNNRIIWTKKRETTKKERACNTAEILQGGLAGHDPAKEDCRVIDGKVVWTPKKK